MSLPIVSPREDDACAPTANCPKRTAAAAERKQLAPVAPLMPPRRRLMSDDDGLVDEGTTASGEDGGGRPIVLGAVVFSGSDSAPRQDARASRLMSPLRRTMGADRRCFAGEQRNRLRTRWTAPMKNDEPGNGSCCCLGTRASEGLLHAGELRCGR